VSITPCTPSCTASQPSSSSSSSTASTSAPTISPLSLAIAGYRWLSLAIAGYRCHYVDTLLFLPTCVNSSSISTVSVGSVGVLSVTCSGSLASAALIQLATL
jgi:hypothetical protein